MKVGLISLGCDKNRVDSEIMLYNLQKGGFELTNNPSDADIIIVNTCAFLESARKESIDTVFEMAKFKQGKCKKLIMTGCLPQKFITEIFDEFFEVDGFLGTNDYADIVPFINGLDKRCYKVSPNTMRMTEGKRILTTDKHYAYLRVADGCNNHCTYCLIPSIRGKYRSRDIESVVAEAGELVKNGTRELIVVAQDLTNYGTDLYGKKKLVELIQKLSLIDKLKWIRLLYCYPELIDDELIDEIATNPKVVKYIDIPLQHSEDRILKLMGRRSTRAEIEALFAKLREKVPDIAIRTTFILGFPTETDEDFDGLKRFVAEQKMDNVGFFAYSQEEGTGAARLNGQIDENVKQKRVKELAKVQFEVVAEKNSALIGREMEVVVDQLVSRAGGRFVFGCRSQHNAPDIDGCVFVETKKQLCIGDFIKATIVRAKGYDLIGRA